MKIKTCGNIKYDSVNKSAYIYISKYIDLQMITVYIWWYTWSDIYLYIKYLSSKYLYI